MVSSKKRTWICAILIGFNLLFIWGNSMLPARLSAALSGWLRELIFGTGLPEGDAEVASFSLRKLAHFLEFASLGGLITWLLAMLRKNTWYYPLTLGTLACLVDETIQGFVPGRAPMLLDVGVDVLGVSLGIVTVNLLLWWLYRKHRKEK